MTTVDLNADLGESFGRWQLGDDMAMVRLVTSANIACGFHAGDPAGLLTVCRAAAAEGVVIGAQVGYRDLAGFGRRFVDVSHADLVADVIYQIGALDALARVAGSRVKYVKPHGALYHAAAVHEGQARAIVEAVRDLDRTLPLVTAPGSLLLTQADAAGLRTVAEAFADRAYQADGTLVPRSTPGALLDDPEEVARRVVQLAVEGRVSAVDGSKVRVQAETICLHGDTPGAAALASRVREALTEAGVRLAPFVAELGRPL